MELGSFCDAIGIDEEVILGQKQVACNIKDLTNGVMWEIQKYRAAKKCGIKDVVDWVIKIFNLQSENSDVLQGEFENNIKNLRDLRIIMVKSPRQYKNELDRLMEWRFELPPSLGLEPIPKFEPATRVNLGPKLLKVLKEKANDDDLSMDMSGQSDNDDDDESRRRKAREELVQLKKDLGSARKIITSLNDRLNDLSRKCKLFSDLSKTSVSQRRRIENDIAKLKTEWNNIIENWHSCIERLNHVNNNKGNYLDVRYMVRRNKTRQGVFDELNLEFEKTVEDFKNAIVSTLDQERRKKKREARQKSKNGQKRPREESSDRDDSKVICLADASDNPVIVSKLSLDEFLKSESVEDFKGGKYSNSLKAIFLYLSSTPVPCPSPSEFIFTVLTQLEELKTDKISSQSFAGNILMEARMLAILHVCSDVVNKSKVSICNESITKLEFSDNSYTVTLPDETHLVLGVRDISDGSPDTSFSIVNDIFSEFVGLKDNNEDFQTLVNAIQTFVVDHQFLNKKIIEILFLYKQRLLPKYKRCLEVMSESLKAKFLTLNNFFTGLYFLQGLAMLSDVTVLVWELMALDINAPELSSTSSAGIHSSTLKKIYAFSELIHPLSDNAAEGELNTFLKKEKKLECIPVAPFKDNIFNVVFHNSAALWFFHEVGYLREYLNQMKKENKMENDVQEENKSENVSVENDKSKSVDHQNDTRENGSNENVKSENVSNETVKSGKEDNREQNETNGIRSEGGDDESGSESNDENKEVEKIEDNISTTLLSSIIEKNSVCIARALGLVGKLVAVPLWTVLEEYDTTDIKTRYATLLQKVEIWSKDAGHFMTGKECLFDDVPLSLDAVYVSLIKASDVYDALTKELLELLFTAFIPYIKYFLFGKSENCVVEDKRSLAADISCGSFSEGFTAFDRVTKNVHLSSSYALDALTVFSKARNGQWLDRLCSKNSIKIVDIIKSDAFKFLKSIYERKIVLDGIKSAKGESDVKRSRCQEIEKKYKLIDDLVKCGGLWKSEKEIDDHLSSMKENERLNALKSQIQFRRHVLNEIHEEGLLDLASEGQCFNATKLCENLKAVLKKEFLGTESDIFEFASASDDEYFVTELSKSCQNAEDKISTDKISFFTKENFQWLLGKLLSHTLSTDKGNESLTGVCIARKKSQGVYSYYIRYCGKDKIFKFFESRIAKDYQNNTLHVVNPSAKDLIGSRVSRAFYKNDGELEWHDCKVIDILNDNENPLFAVEYEMYGANVETSGSESDLPELHTLTFSCHLLEDYKTDRLRLL